MLFNDDYSYRSYDYENDIDAPHIATLSWLSMLAASAIVLSLLYCYVISRRGAVAAYQPVTQELTEYKVVTP